MGKAVGLFVSRYPCLTQTFVISEMEALSRVWPEQYIFHFFREKGETPHMGNGVIHLKPHKLYLRSQLYFLSRSAAGYFRILMDLIRGYAGERRELAKTLLLWPKMVHAAFIARKLNLQAIHAHWASLPCTAAYVVSEFLGLPFTFTSHAYDIYLSGAFMDRKLLAARKCITISEYNRQYLYQKNPRTPPGRIEVIHCGVDVNAYSVGAPPPSGPFTLLTVGRMTWQKGFPTLIRALALLKDWNLDFTLKFLGVEGPSSALTHSLIKEHCLENHIQWIKPRPAREMPRIYANTHAFVLPCEIGPDGDRDGIPVVIMEAMASGLPVVTTTVSGLPEIVFDGETGFTIPPLNPQKLARAIRRLYDSRDLCLEMGANARRLIEAEFNKSKNQQKCVDLMRKIHFSLSGDSRQ